MKFEFRIVFNCVEKTATKLRHHNTVLQKVKILAKFMPYLAKLLKFGQMAKL